MNKLHSVSWKLRQCCFQDYISIHLVYNSFVMTMVANPQIDGHLNYQATVDKVMDVILVRHETQFRILCILTAVVFT